MRLGLAFLAGMAALPSAPARGGPAESGCVGPESKTRIYVTVEGVRSSNGLVAITIYADDRKRFLVRHGSLYVARVPARAPLTRACVRLPSTGTYALAVYHDADGNRKFKRNALGMPAEGFGFSNNASTVFGLPAFGSVRLAVPRSDMETRVKLRYP